MTAIDMPATATAVRIADAFAPVGGATAGSQGRHRSGAARGIAGWTLVRRMVRWMTGTVLTVAALASVALTVFIAVGHIGFSPVLSPSMRPSFAPGDLIVTKPEAAADIRVGQVLVLPVPGEKGQRYVHRVIEVAYQKGRPVVRTKGDANGAPENFRLTITSKKVPVVVNTVPRMGRLALLFRGGSWRVGAIVLIGALFLVGIKRALLDR
jgi:signal peptidase I